MREEAATAIKLEQKKGWIIFMYLQYVALYINTLIISVAKHVCMHVQC